MKLFKDYLKQKARYIVLFLLCIAIYIAVFTMYKIPLAAIVYPTLLSFLLCTAIFIYDFIKLKRKHSLLCRIDTLTSVLITELPETSEIDDVDYQRIIELLKHELSEAQNLFDRRFCDTVNYYTVWAHQIKTPIASMHLSLQNEDSPLSRKLEAELFKIEQYVEMVLAFLRLDSVSTDYVFKEHRLDEILRSSIKKFSSDFISRHLRLEYEPTEKAVITDEKWLSFVLEQLLSNALKYTREGCIKIFMRDENTLCIEDTGIGIAAEDLPRIFEKGYTGCNGRSDKKASGLGLYLCKRICENLSIGISAASEVDKGTVISLDFSQYKLKVND